VLDNNLSLPPPFPGALDFLQKMVSASQILRECRQRLKGSSNRKKGKN